MSLHWSSGKSGVHLSNQVAPPPIQMMAINVKVSVQILAKELVKTMPTVIEL